ncbi:MAG TPA: hypothetical protein DDX14_01395, partial [Cyanobacteria bacterium UBA9579]|nr:hypothetical protein [Cyanobacteria bacterium UBA9579]
TKFYTPGIAHAKSRCQQGETWTGALAFAQQANKLPLLKLQVESTGKVYNNLTRSLPVLRQKINTMDQFVTDPHIKSVYNQFYGNSKHGAQISQFGFFKYTFTEGKMKNSAFGRTLLSMDKNLTDYKCIRDGFSKFFNGAQIKTISQKGAASRFVVGAQGAKASYGATITGKALGRIPVFGMALSAVFELPAIAKAFKNGDGINQIGRSATNIAGYTAGAALLGAAMTVVLPPLGGFIGAALGVYAGGKIAKKVGDFIFGKSIAEQKQNFFK